MKWETHTLSVNQGVGNELLVPFEISSTLWSPSDWLNSEQWVFSAYHLLGHPFGRWILLDEFAVGITHSAGRQNKAECHYSALAVRGGAARGGSRGLAKAHVTALTCWALRIHNVLFPQALLEASLIFQSSERVSENKRPVSVDKSDWI